MDSSRIRSILLIALGLLGFSLYYFWQNEQQPATENATLTQPASHNLPSPSSLATVNTAQERQSTQTVADTITVDTDVFKLTIDKVGGDIIRAELKNYPQLQNNPHAGVMLLNDDISRHYVAQTGLIGNDNQGPDSHQFGQAHYQSAHPSYALQDQKDLIVELTWQSPQGLKIVKSFIFKAGDYLVDIQYRIQNPLSTPWYGKLYGQIQRQFDTSESGGFFGVQMYQGAALKTNQKAFKKISFSDMQKKPLHEQVNNGWAALLERYFLCAFIPPADQAVSYYSRVDDNNIYNIGGIYPVEVGGQSEKTVSSSLYIGPEIQETLKNIAPGLQLTIDYGFLWPISQLLFWLLKSFHQFIGNWGVAIILVTCTIKLLFYKLSAASYRSMGRMRLLQPKVEALKQRHAQDKQQLSLALMELYRKEKMNPLGGCLPILVQIPVFIALYYVLLESVELRHAPFIGWIHDLSSKDPYYIMPLIMGATMFLQQKMNPAPADPIQAKMMLFMPVVFTVLFVSFPAGLVLYWTVNNLLSVLQQWYITKNMTDPSTPLIKRS